MPIDHTSSDRDCHDESVILLPEPICLLFFLFSVWQVFLISEKCIFALMKCGRPILLPRSSIIIINSLPTVKTEICAQYII